MDRFLTCQLCGEKLSFNPLCTCSLGEHLIQKHPDVDMTHFIVDDLSLCDCDDETPAMSIRGGTSIVMQEQQQHGLHGLQGTQGTNGTSKTQKTQGTKSGVFKTTVETWKPGPQIVNCPSCGKEDRPCIRKQRNKIAYTHLGALCMISCWPICFLPFLMPQSSVIHLYCKHCGALLGEYNRQTGGLKPVPVDPRKKMNVPSNMC